MTGEKTLEKFSDVAVIVPAYNEEPAIAGVISGLKKNFGTVLIVDDGSSDKTAQIARTLGAEVLTHPKRKGKGAAIRSGVEKILSNTSTVRAVLLMDGDGQHHPEDAARLASFWLERGGDAILGERDFRSRAMPRLRTFWNASTSKLLSWAAGKDIRDSQCGLRLYSRALLPRILPRSKGYVAESEMLAKAVLASAKIFGVPIRTIYTKRPTFRTVKDFRRAGAILFFILKLASKNHLLRHGFASALVLAAFWLLIFRLIAFDIGVAKGRYLNPDASGADFIAAMEFLRMNSPEDSVVLSEWTQGHQIVALADMRTVATSKVYPSEAGKLAARFRDISKFFFAASPEEAKEVIEKYGIDYVFLRKKNFDFYLCEYHNRCGRNEALIYKLLAGEATTFLQTIYETDRYKILKVAGQVSRPVHYAGFGRDYNYFLGELEKKEKGWFGNIKMSAGIVPHHYPFTEEFFPEFFAHLKRARPQVVVLIGPDHENEARSTIAFSERVWLTPFGEISPDTALIRRLKERFGEIDERTHHKEWSLAALIPYLKVVAPEAKIVPILMRSDLDFEKAEEFGRELANILPEDAVIILSADFAHRLSKEETKEADETSRQVIDSLEIASGMHLELDARTGLVALFSALNSIGGTRSQLLGYGTSETLHEKNPERFPSHPYIVSYFSYVFGKNK